MLEKHNIELAGRDATVLGSGGAAKTVIRYLLDHGVDNIVLVTRSISNYNLLVRNGNYEKI